MTDRIIDGRTMGRRQLLQMLRDVCADASGLCDEALIASGRWQHRAEPTVKSCVLLQRGLISSHPQVADELHILSTEILIALAARPHDALFAARIQKIRDVVHRLHQSDIAGDRTE